LIADANVDLVDICLPPAAHAATAIKALGAGKHVFCEKPIALDPADADKMVAAARRAKRQLMIGHVLPFFPQFAYAHQLATSKKHGKLLGASFKRITADPQWLKHYYEPKVIGGPLLDLHVHDAHFIRLLFGMPRAVFSAGRMRGEVVEFFQSIFLFDEPGVAVHATSGAIRQQGRGFTHGFEIHYERATLLQDFTVIQDKAESTMPLTLVTNDGKVERPKLGSGDPIDSFAAEIQQVVAAIRTGRPSPILVGDLARDAVVLCQRQAQSVATGRVVKV
jgi:predicted dehydrogenase